jgi:hypothetical protein
MATTPVEALFQQAKRSLNEEDSDNCGKAFPEERKRTGLFEEIIHPATITPGSQLRWRVFLLGNGVRGSANLRAVVSLFTRGAG